MPLDPTSEALGYIVGLIGKRALVFNERVYSAAAALVPTGTNGAQWVLFNKSTGDRVLWVIDAAVTVTAAMQVDAYLLNADPALGGAFTPAPRDAPQSEAIGATESAVGAAPATFRRLDQVQAAAGHQFCLLGDSPLRLQRGYGLMVATAAVAGSASCSITWAELVE